MKKLTTLIIFIFLGIFTSTQSYASATIKKKIAELQVVDKITAHRSVVYTKLNKYVNFQTMRIKVKSCFVNKPTRATEAEAYLIIMDTPKEKKEYKAFEGWMFASTPSLVALKHPVYDVTIINCLDKIPKK